MNIASKWTQSEDRPGPLANGKARSALRSHATSLCFIRLNCALPSFSQGSGQREAMPL